jgi:thiol:disulfide interchange protein
MIATTSSRTLLLSAALLASISIAGCKGTQPAPPAPVASAPSASVPSTPSKPVPVTAPPAVKKHLYSQDANPRADIASALAQARREHKRIILDFGGDWCGDCQVLDIYFHQSPNTELVDKNFLVVHIDIGHMDRNVDVAEKYGIPLKKGVPALAVIDAAGKVLYSQKTGEFEDMRYMHAASVTDFLNRWKA